MNRILGLIIALVLAGILISWSGPAVAKHNRLAFCMPRVSKELAKLAKAHSKHILRCLKEVQRGRLELADVDLEVCIRDTAIFGRDRVAGRIAKALRRFGPGGKCRFLPFIIGRTDVELMVRVAKEKELLLIHDLFGSDLDAERGDTGTPLFSSTGADSRCQLAVAKEAFKCQAASFKEYIRCKKAGFKAEGEPGTVPDPNAVPFDEPADLEACIGFDPRGKIAAVCTARMRVKLEKHCGTAVSLGPAVPGCAPATPMQLADCVDRRVQCRVCLALNEADGIARNCDEFDDGQPNGSCSGAPICGDGIVNGLPNEECDGRDDRFCPGSCQPDCMCGGTRIIGAHECVLNDSSGLAAGGQTSFGIPSEGIFFGGAEGTLRVVCGEVDPNTGTAPCECDGYAHAAPGLPAPLGACLFSTPACFGGQIDCDGGQVSDVDLLSDHNIGACTADTGCSTQCDTYCSGLGKSTVRSSCEGAQDLHPGICRCHCESVGGLPGGVGAISCRIGGLFGTDTSGDQCAALAESQSTPLGARCVTLTTEATHALILNADNTIESLGPVQAVGEPISCPVLVYRGLRGLPPGGGGVSFVVSANTFDWELFGTPLWDMSWIFNARCE